jgi:AraC-like DNA-binding protein
MTAIDERHINYARIEKAIRFLGDNFQRQPELEEVAEKVHLSPFHFQRIFADWAGISPKRFLQVLTVDFLKDKLLETSNLIEAAERAGLSAQSRVYDLFTTLEAVTPQEHKTRGSGLQIEYGIHRLVTRQGIQSTAWRCKTSRTGERNKLPGKSLGGAASAAGRTSRNLSANRRKHRKPKSVASGGICGWFQPCCLPHPLPSRDQEGWTARRLPMGRCQEEGDDRIRNDEEDCLKFSIYGFLRLSLRHPEEERSHKLRFFDSARKLSS